MKLFIWSGDTLGTDVVGGVVIVAENLGDAQLDWRDHHQRRDALFRFCMPAELPLPNRTLEVDAYSRAEVIVFPGPGAA